MTDFTDAKIYEKGFLEKFTKKRALRKIEEFEKKILLETNLSKILKLQEKIKIVNEELKTELEIINQKEELIIKQALGDKSDDLMNYKNEDHLIQNIKCPRNIWEYLFDYQKEGVEWMVGLYNNEKGGVLADEMGLGKTIQILTFIISLIHSNKGSKYLILCPSTLINQWISEFERLTESLKERKYKIMVLSYERFRINDCDLELDGIFLDEGHKVKNKDSLIAQTVKKVKTLNRFVITGTPIQNDLSELWSIFDFINPNLLGSYKTFQNEFESTIKRGKTEKDKNTSYEFSVLLRSIIEPYIKRRLKSGIDHKLPDKSDKVVFINLSAEQRELYTRTLESERFLSLKRNMSKKKETVLGAMTYLRKICNHPLLINGINSDKISLALKGLKNNVDLIEGSCKVKVALEMLQKWREDGKKALVFFQTVQMLYIFEFILKEYYQDFNFNKMSGKTDLRQRTLLIDNFNSDPNIFIFLLTTKVGGFGLNLTGANRIIIFDPDWNPSTDNQAKERIYRFGQKSEVEIYRLVTRNTIEEKIYEKQIYKDSLSRKILVNPELNFAKEFFFDIFSYYDNFDQETKSNDNSGNFEICQDQLVEIKEQDLRNFKIIQDLNMKKDLNGSQLIEYIVRRESGLNDIPE